MKLASNSVKSTFFLVECINDIRPVCNSSLSHVHAGTMATKWEWQKNIIFSDWWLWPRKAACTYRHQLSILGERVRHSLITLRTLLIFHRFSPFREAPSDIFGGYHRQTESLNLWLLLFLRIAIMLKRSCMKLSAKWRRLCRQWLPGTVIGSGFALRGECAYGVKSAIQCVKFSHIDTHTHARARTQTRTHNESLFDEKLWFYVICQRCTKKYRNDLIGFCHLMPNTKEFYKWANRRVNGMSFVFRMLSKMCGSCNLPCRICISTSVFY